MPASGRSIGSPSKRTTSTWASGFDDGSGVSIDSTAITASALLLAEIGIVDLYARVGMANWDSDFNAHGVGSVSDDGWEPTYGVGIGVHFGSIGVRLEYEKFSTDALDDFLDDRRQHLLAERHVHLSVASSATGRVVTT